MFLKPLSSYHPWLSSPLSWLHHSERQNALIRSLVDRVRHSLELKVVLQTAVDELATILKLDRCSFFWCFQDTQQIEVVCEQIRTSDSDTPDASHRSNLGYYPLSMFGAAATAIAQGKLVVNSGKSAAGGLQSWITAPQKKAHPASLPFLNATANVLVPVRSQETFLGFIACLSEQPRRWSTAEITFLQSVAEPLAIAIRQAQLYEQTQKQAQRERLVNQITAQTRQSLELSTILNGAIAQLLEALAVDRCLVHLVEDPDSHPESRPSIENGTDPQSQQSAFRSKHLYEVCRSPFPATIDTFDTDGPMTRWIIQTRRRVVITDVTQDERIGADNVEYQQAQIKSSLVLPVQTKDTLYAILYLNQCAQVRYWSKHDQKLAQAVADQLAISIQQAHLYERTRQQAAQSAAQASYLAEALQELRLTQAQLIQSEKMSSLGRLVAGVAHEINNPINFIYGNVPYIETYVTDLLQLLQAYQSRIPDPDAALREMAEVMELDFLVSDLPHILQSMRSGADRIRQIVLSLRNFSRLDEAERKTVDIHQGIESTLLVLQANIATDIQIIRQYGNLPPVECYPAELNQALMNLMMNAVEALSHWHGEQKAIAICTDFVPESDHQAAMIRIVITDNGPGIDHAIQPKIFDPFFTTKAVGQGTGLGLTASYQTVVNQHRGRLTVCSEPGLGAEFMIELPVKHHPIVQPQSNLPFSIPV